jgi:hypothetical protein
VVVVRLDFERAQADREQPRAQDVGVLFARDIGRVHDLRHPFQRMVAAEFVIVDQDLEGALVPAVRELGVRRVEGVGAFALRDRQHLVRGDVDDLRFRVDEAADEPGAGNAVCLRAGSGHPFHADTSSVAVSPG